MGKIIMRLSAKILGLFFLLNWLSLGMLLWLVYGGSIDLNLLLFAAGGASFVITTFTGIMVYLKQPCITVDFNGIHTDTSGSKSIFYRNIREVQIGQGAMKIFTADRTVTISNFYSNYDEAAAMVKNMIKGRDDITVTRRDLPAGLVLLTIE